jgi:hypothetical protein
LPKCFNYNHTHFFFFFGFFVLGTHSAFEEIIHDYELKREKTISDAECFMKYQISFIEQYFDQDINALEDEYEVNITYTLKILRRYSS